MEENIIGYKWMILFLIFTFGGAIFNQIWMAFLGGACFIMMLEDFRRDAEEKKKVSQHE